MITISIPKESTFQLPEGNYSATICQVKPQLRQTGSGTQERVRILFDVSIPGMEEFICMAGRNFTLNLNPGSDLRNFLEGLLTRQYFMNRSGKSFNMEELCGMECELTLIHFSGRNYDKPMVVVDRIAPPNTLRLTKGGKD